jgi:hypothetical protein
MSKFKTNSRFSSLVENDQGITDKKLKEKKNSQNEKNKIEQPFSDNNDSSFKKHNKYNERKNTSFKDEQTRIEEDKIKAIKLKEESIRKALAPESFPDLISKPINITPINYISFSEKLKKIDINTTNDSGIDKDYKNLPPGWVFIKKDDTTNEIITRKKPSLEVATDINEPDNFELLDALVELHEKRTNKYIELWGYDEWENMFIFPNYDYDYFEKLDELYYQEIDEEESEGEEDYYESISDYDKFYWNN